MYTSLKKKCMINRCRLCNTYFIMEQELGNFLSLELCSAVFYICTMSVL